MLFLVPLLARLLVAVGDMIVKFFKSHKTGQTIALVLEIIFIVAALIVAIIPKDIHLPLGARAYGIFAVVIIALLMIPTLAAYTDKDITGLMGNFSSFMLGEQLSKLEKQRTDLEAQRHQQETSLTSSDATTEQGLNLFGTDLQLNLNELREYYLINKSQARTSFVIGVIAVLLGLGAILVGVGLLFAGSAQKHHIAVATVTAVAGLLGQFIGGSCLYLFNKAQDQSSHYYDRLTELQGILLAVRLAGTINTGGLADTTRQQIILALIKNDPKK